MEAKKHKAVVAAELSQKLEVRVFPVWSPNKNGVCRCPKGAECHEPGKHPMLWNGHVGASSDVEQIVHWFVRAPWASVGAVPSSQWVLDIDAGHGGEESLARLEAQHGALPATVTALTGGGGRHLWFARTHLDRPHDLFGPVRHGVNVFGPEYPGIDTRTNKGYLVMPPSMHRSGNPYQWVEGRGPGEIAVSATPWWLYQAVQPVQRAAA